MKKSNLIYQVIFLYLFLFLASCQKEVHPAIEAEKNTENRSTPDLNIQFENLTVIGCCFSVTIRTTIDENHPTLLNKLFLFRNGQFISLLIQGPADEWTQDPNQPGSYTYDYANCLETNGNFTIYSNKNPEEGGALLHFDITDCHPEKCLYYLCWEDFAMHFRYFTGITVSNNNQTDFIVFYPEILSPGGYTQLYQVIKTQFPLQTEGPIWMGNLQSNHENIDCFKAGIEEIPGLFISESNYRIVSIHGLDHFFMPLPPVYFNSLCEE